MPAPRTARPPLVLVNELAGRDILVTLHLSSGRDVRGTLLDVTHHRGVDVALIGNVRVASDVTHVSLAMLEAVTVHDAHLIGAPPVPDPTPGKLEVRRLLAALGERLRIAFDTDALELADAGALAASLPALEEALRAIAADEMGKDALAKITHAKLGVASDAKVTRDGTTLAIHAAREYGARPAADGWRTELERAL